jgi:hypothetical protein
MRFVITTAVLGLFLATPASSSDLLGTQSGMTSVVEVRDVKGDAGSVSGRLVNLTGHTLSNLKLSVSDTFSWTSERNPGSADPSQAGTYMLAQQIPPKGSAPFTVQRRATLPTRSDGQFQTKVEVTGVTQTPRPPIAY